MVSHNSFYSEETFYLLPSCKIQNYMYRPLIPFIILSIFSFPSEAQHIASKEYLQHTIRVLASDSLQGRKSGSSFEHKAAVYIRDYFQTMGLTMLGNEGMQPFQFTGMKGTLNSQNVVVRLEGSDSILKKECIVIGAHYDHIGQARFPYSRRWLLGGMHYGADDNASGTAMVMELARLLSNERANLRRSIIFVMFGAEEQGLVGSRYFVNNLPSGTGRIVAMINFDMVGRLGTEHKLFLSGEGTATELTDLLNTLPVPDHLDVVRFKTGKGSTDSQSFYTAGFPVMSFITGLHMDYHTPGDTEDKINYNGMTAISEYGMELTEALANRSSGLTYTHSDERYPNDEIQILPAWEFRGHLSGFYIGCTTLANKDHEFSLPSGYHFLKTSMVQSVQAGMVFWSKGLKITKNSGLSCGIGAETSRLSFTGNFPIASGSSKVEPDSSFLFRNITLRSNALNTLSLRVPVMLEVKTPSRKKSAYIAAGITGSLRLNTVARISYKTGSYRNRESIRGTWFSNPFNWSVQARAGYGRIGVYADYRMSSLFKKDAAPELYPFSVGITVNLRK